MAEKIKICTSTVKISQADGDMRQQKQISWAREGQHKGVRSWVEYCKALRENVEDAGEVKISMEDRVEIFLQAYSRSIDPLPDTSMSIFVPDHLHTQHPNPYAEHVANRELRKSLEKYYYKGAQEKAHNDQT